MNENQKTQKDTARAEVSLWSIVGLLLRKIHWLIVAGLVSGAGIGEINAVEKDHGLVERASPDEDVGLHALAPAFADIDRRCEAQGGLQGLDGRCGLCFPVEKRGVRLGVARGSRLTPGDADFPDPQCLEDSGRVGSLRGRTLRRK